MIESLTDKLQLSKKLRQEQGLHRTRKLIKPNTFKYHFSSNDYLSLSLEPEIKSFYQAGLFSNPVGSSGSIVVCGYHQAHKDLERYFSKLLNVEDCLLFSSGYAANLSVVSLLASHNTSIIIDKSVHASIYDGLKLSGAKYTRYLHNNLNSLSNKINNLDFCQNSMAILTESIFSMSGQIAPLLDIAKLAKSVKASLIVDEAHAFGIYGPQGLGGVSNCFLNQDDVPLRVIPFGKSVGASGAIVAGKGIWIEELLQMRAAVYSTAISPAFAYGLQHTVEYIINANDRRKKLSGLVEYFKQLISKSSFNWRNSDTPIQQLQLGCPYLATKIADQLLAKSILCLPIRQPTVTKEETGLRVIINHNHEKESLDYLFECLEQL